jgi:hypothetical protein
VSRATKTQVPAAASEIVPFRTKHEEGWLINADAVPPALIINPAATLESVLSAAQARISHLDRSLNMWSCARLEIDDVSGVVYPLRTLAEETEMLLDHAKTLMRRAGRQS